MHRRTRARRLVMLALYQADLLSEEYLDDTRAWLAATGNDADLSEFSMGLFDSTLGSQSEIDALIETVAQNWHLSRMAAIDRALLRMAVCEMLFHKDAPPKVVINEAVELAKRYSTAASGSFVNGILDRIHKDEIKTQ